ncbi:MAG TPA: FAD-dependent oxidoreductase [Acidocella sp.]|jgi:2,4-dienoyl-CoA reductase-like NADH-dependent reductase (Old Yellow Enzyme family)|nr:FAD-dependent oxidoreductase [Acidocella sp.]
MHAKYPRIFTPLRLGPVEVPARFFFAPHGSALSAGTKPSDDLVAYSAERVRDGGCGLVILAMVVHERGRTRQPSPHPEQNIAAFRVMTDAIHEAGGKIFGQVFYWWGGYGQWQPLSPPAPSLGPSVRQFGYNERTISTHEMGQAEIQAMHAAMRQTARNMREAGFDGLLLHGSHAGLIEQCLSPYFNARTDEYGGSFENRMRFMVESLQAAREGAGPDLAVGIRINCDEMLPGGYGVETARAAVETICKRGLVDYVDLDMGVEPQQFYHGMPTSFVEPLPYRASVAQVRQAAGDVPVLSVLGRVTDMAQAEAALAEGVCDMAGAARQLIAEPRFVQNARAGLEDQSRTCIACNWCTAAMGDGAQGCTINPASYRERLWGVARFAPAARPSQVIVIGGGPGGMEAARVSALKGHRVTLFEARGRLGGALALWADLPGREINRQAIVWWERELARLKVDVRLNSTASPESVLAERPDAVIIATGARYSTGGRSVTFDADIPGHDQDFVFRPEEILLGGARPQGRVLLLDGEGLHASAGIAELLGREGAEVSYVTAGFSPLSPRLIDNFEARFIIKRLKQAGVRFKPGAWVRRIGAQEVTLYDTHTGEEWGEAADAVVLVTGRVPQDSLARALEGKVAQLFTIGDALAARPLAAASYEGQKFARLIGEPEAPRDFVEAFFRADEAAVMILPADMKRG